MMNILHAKTAEGSRYQIEAAAVLCQNDVSVTICGGSGHHVGAVALGCSRPEYEGKPKRSATVSVICAFEHKDDEAARWAARYLATELDCRVSVSVGIHIDNAGLEELNILMENCSEVCRQLVKQIKQSK